MASLPKVILKKGKEKPLMRGHPWVFSGAVAKVEGEFYPGEVGEVYSNEGEFLGVGHLNPNSQIIFRLLSLKKEALGIDFFKDRISKAFILREKGLKGRTNAFRLVNGEGDFLPGLIVDRYGEVLVIQCLTAGIDRVKGSLVELLGRQFRAKSIYERSDVATRQEEGLPQTSGPLYGEEISDPLEIEEYGCRFKVDVKRGQKTGFYLDQRENRFFLQRVTEGKRVLDCFSYSGAFSIHAGLGGAKEVTLIDSSAEALELAQEHFILNSLTNVRRELIRGDAFDVLRSLKRRYDLIILDPPPFAKKKGQLQAASRGYKELNLQAFRLLEKDGLLLTFTCSHHVSWDLFQKIVFSAAIDSGKKVQVLRRMGHPIDHPINLCHPEGEYLRGMFCRVF